MLLNALRDDTNGLRTNIEEWEAERPKGWGGNRQGKDFVRALIQTADAGATASASAAAGGGGGGGGGGPAQELAESTLEYVSRVCP